MDPWGHLTENTVPAKKKGKEHDGERWELIIFTEEGRHKEFTVHGAKSIWWRRKDKLQRFMSRFSMRKCFTSRLRAEVRIHVFLYEKCSLKGCGLLLSPLGGVGSFTCLLPHKVFCLQMAIPADFGPWPCAMYMVIRVWGLRPCTSHYHVFR